MSMGGLLIDRQAEVGVEVERQTELLGFKDATTRVLARLNSHAYMPGATAHILRFAKHWTAIFRVGYTLTCSTSPTWKQADPA